MSRRLNRCNELISTEQREKVLHLFVKTGLSYAHISQSTKVPIAKIKQMTKDLERPFRTPPLTAADRTRLLMQW